MVARGRRAEPGAVAAAARPLSKPHVLTVRGGQPDMLRSRIRAGAGRYGRARNMTPRSPAASPSEGRSAWSGFTRRDLLRRAAAAAAAAAGAVACPFVSSRNVLGANMRLNIAAIGVGGVGEDDVGYCRGEN